MAAGVLTGDLRQRRVTLSQAARVLGMDLGSVRKTVGRGWLAPTYMRFGGRRTRALDGIDMVCVMIAGSVAPPVRNLVYDELRHWPADRPLRGTVALEMDAPTGRRMIDVPLDRSVAEIVSGLAALDRTSELIDATDDTIRGTGIEAHRVAALVNGGMPLEEILQDYRTLTAAQVEAAVAYAKAHPNQDARFPSRTFKSFLRNGKGGLAIAFAAARDGD